MLLSLKFKVGAAAQESYYSSSDRRQGARTLDCLFFLVPMKTGLTRSGFASTECLQSKYSFPLIRIEMATTAGSDRCFTTAEIRCLFLCCSGALRLNVLSQLSWQWLANATRYSLGAMVLLRYESLPQTKRTKDYFGQVHRVAAVHTAQLMLNLNR